MARDFNQNRNTNAKLVSADINTFGKTFAIQSPWNADGFSSVNISVQPVPTDIKEYLEGNDNITVFACASNIDKLCEYALMSFPSIQELYLFKNNGVVTIEDDLSYLENLKLMYVASDYVSSYSSYTIITSDYQSFTSVDDYVGKVVDTNLINNKYTTFTSVDDYLKSYVVYNGVMTYVTNDNKNDLGIIAGTTIAYFGASAYKVTNDNKNDLFIVSGVTIAYDRLVTNIVEDYTLTIPFVGDTTLTSEYVDSVIAMLSSAQKNAITKVVIDSGFTQGSTYNVCKTYDFSSLINLDDNIWWGNIQGIISTMLGNNQPSGIREVIRDNKTLDYWSLGDTIDITLTNNKIITMRLVDATQGRYDFSQGNEKSNAVFMITKIHWNYAMYSPWLGSVVWNDSQMCLNEMPTLYNLFPLDWQNAISEVKTGSAIDRNDRDSAIAYANTKCFIPSSREIANDGYYTNEITTQYGFYVGSTSADRILLDEQDNAISYWCRNLHFYGANFANINTSGNYDHQRMDYSLGVAICFAI